MTFAARTKSAETGRRYTGDAQILIFTGVRYERGTTPPPKTDDSTRRKRKRG